MRRKRHKRGLGNCERGREEDGERELDIIFIERTEDGTRESIWEDEARETEEAKDISPQKYSKFRNTAFNGARTDALSCHERRIRNRRTRTTSSFE